MPDSFETIELFIRNAGQVSATVGRFASAAEAISSAVDRCSLKEACTLLPSGCEADLSEKARDLCDAKPGRHIVAAPGLKGNEKKQVGESCLKHGIRTVFQGLRQHLGGIDMAITRADFGIAETGTLVINSTDEDLRLATMVSEIHAVLLETGSIVKSADDITEQLRAWMGNRDNYTAFITGASRTADIERVLATGVHGPLELYILLIGDDL